MDIITVFGTVVVGSNPAGCTATRKPLGFRAGFENLELIARSVASTIRKVYSACKARSLPGPRPR